MKPKQEDPKEMVGGCCVCSDENGWAENPLVYCDGQGCNVAVHQACYGIVTVPTGAWFCRKCESQERAARVRCELCPSKDGALKRTDSGGWAHVVCALYIPEVRFGNVTTMEPIMLQLIPQERFNKSCYLCDEGQRGSKATIGACMQCNRAGCKNHFHVTCAQAMGLLCEEAGNYLDNVKYCGYCQYHYNKLRRGSHVKTIPPYRPVPHDVVSSDEDKTANAADSKEKLKRRSGKSSPVHETNKQLTRELKVQLGDLSGPSKTGNIGPISGESSSQEESSVNLDISLSVVQNSVLNIKAEPKVGEKQLANTSSGQNLTTTITTTTVATLASNKQTTIPSSSVSESKANSGTFLPMSNLSHSTSTVTSSTSSSTAGPSTTSTSESATSSAGTIAVAPSTSSSAPNSISSSSASTSGDNSAAVVSTVISLPSKLKLVNTVNSVSSSHSTTATSHGNQSSMSVSLSNSNMEKDRQRKTRRNGSGSRSNSVLTDDIGMEDSSSKEGALIICEERNLSAEKPFTKIHSSPEEKLNVHFTTNVSVQAQKLDAFAASNVEAFIGEPMKRARSSSQDRGRRTKRGASGGGGNISKRGRVALSSREKETSRDSGASSPESPLASETVQTKRGGRGAKIIPEVVKDTKELVFQKNEPLATVITNGVGANALLLGNQINPASAVAQKMADTLHAELEAHSIYKEEEKVNINLVGPSLPGKKEPSAQGSSLTTTQPPPLPQSLEQLLERQWEQGSQFLMEQAQHFDIASLLSCLHQLRQENVRLEDMLNNLVSRRDHLLAVNARLGVPLGQTLSQASTSSTASSLSNTLSGGGPPSTSSHSTPTSSSLSSLVPNTLSSAAPPPLSTTLITGPLQIAQSGMSTATVLTSRAGVHPQQRHPSGGNSHVSHGVPSSSGGRGASPHERRNLHQGPPLENGLTEQEYRYRSPGSDHHQRQQSPMLPPGAQPSPTSMRQSPASTSYHSVSPHTGVPSLSPSGVNHPPPPQHTLITHVTSHGPHGGHPPGLASSSHGPPHTVALNRTSEHARAELVRLASTQSHPTPGVGYPVYQMVSPPVPGPHHSPVGMQQHPPHSQALRREVESSRGSHSLEKR